MILVNHLKDTEVADSQEVFHLIDKDDNGSIDIGEMQEALEELSK